MKTVSGGFWDADLLRPASQSEEESYYLAWEGTRYVVKKESAELRPLIGACGYRNCLHLEEPGCAVRTAVDGGDVRASRYASYRAMYDEVVAADADR